MTVGAGYFAVYGQAKQLAAGTAGESSLQLSLIVAGCAVAIVVLTLFYAGRLTKKTNERLRALQNDLSQESGLRKLAERALDVEERLDPITGLGRLGYFNSRADLSMARARRYEKPLTLLLVSIEDFAKFSWQIGIANRNEALQKLTAALKDCLREIDVLAQLDNGQFVILLEEASPDNANIVIDRIRGEMDPIKAWVDENGARLRVEFGKSEVDLTSGKIEAAIEDARAEVTKRAEANFSALDSFDQATAKPYEPIEPVAGDVGADESGELNADSSDDDAPEAAHEAGKTFGAAEKDDEDGSEKSETSDLVTGVFGKAHTAEDAEDEKREEDEEKPLETADASRESEEEQDLTSAADEPATEESEDHRGGTGDDMADIDDRDEVASADDDTADSDDRDSDDRDVDDRTADERDDHREFGDERNRDERRDEARAKKKKKKVRVFAA